jgi:large conductance mechanosensitive channel
MLNEFKKFVLRGNVIDLSTGVIIGASFGAIVKAFSDGIITPVLKLIGGDPKNVTLGFPVKDVYFDLGLIISAMLSFLITAAVVFFLIIKPMNRLTELMLRQEPKGPEAPVPPDVQLLTEIRDLLKAQGGTASGET